MLELLIIPKLWIVTKSVFVTETQHEFVKCTKMLFKPYILIQILQLLIKNDQTLTVWILEKKNMFIFVVLIMFKK